MSTAFIHNHGNVTNNCMLVSFGDQNFTGITSISLHAEVRKAIDVGFVVHKEAVALVLELGHLICYRSSNVCCIAACCFTRLALAWSELVIELRSHSPHISAYLLRASALWDQTHVY